MYSTNKRFFDYLENKSQSLAYFEIDNYYLRFVTQKPNPDPIRDRITFCQSINNPCLINIGDIHEFVPGLKTSRTILDETSDSITHRISFDTPLGPKGWILKKFKTSVENIEEAQDAPVCCSEDFELFDWYKTIIENNNWSASIDQWRARVQNIGNAAIPYMFICPPVSLLCWIKRQDLFLMYHDYRDRYENAMQCVINAYKVILNVIRDAGVRVIFYGAPGGTEFTSPAIWQDAIVPTSMQIESFCRQVGLYSIFHCCGKITTLLQHGFISRIKPTILETLSPLPTGDIADVSAARRLIDNDVATHGNIDLLLLKDGQIGNVLSSMEKLLSDVKGFRHIVGGSDACLLPGTPPENIKIICDQCNLANS